MAHRAVGDDAAPAIVDNRSPLRLLVLIALVLPLALLLIGF